MKKLIKQIEQWAIERDLHRKGTVEGQAIKTFEEAAELIIGISKDDIELIKDSIGDVFVTLVVGNMLDEKFKVDNIDFWVDVPVEDARESTKGLILSEIVRDLEDITVDYYNELNIRYLITDLKVVAKYYNLNFKQCVQSAYDEIKNRKGKMINGTFVKEE